MSGLFEYLNDPQLVCRFQRFCGVVPGKKCSNSASTDTPPASQCKDNGALNIQNGLVQKRKSAICDNTAVAYSSGSGSESDKEEEEDYTINSKLIYWMMRLGAELGNEAFYILFWPYWLWNVDGYVCRRACLFWGLIMYIGQAAKDVIKWPRPASPPAMRLEKRYALEYGFPSTHAMVGAGIPFAMLYFTMQRYIYPFEYGFIVATTWALLVCASRLYLGMHSVLDVLGGLVFVVVLMALIFPVINAIDHFNLHYPYSPVITISVPFFMCLSYPRLDKWSTARGDTTICVGVTTGMFLGHWYSFQDGFMQQSATEPPYPIIPPSLEWLGMTGMRLMIGVIILVSTRAVVKAVTYRLACYLAGICKNDSTAHQHLVVELPYKFITYTTIAFNAVYIAPKAFRILGIERETYFTEL